VRFLLLVLTFSIHAQAEIPWGKQTNNASVLGAVNNTETPIERKQQAQSFLRDKLGLQSNMKIQFSLQNLTFQSDDTYYVKMQICDRFIYSNCIESSSKTSDFNLKNIGATVLDFDFENLNRKDWIGFAGLAQHRNPILVLTVMKKTAWYNRKDEPLDKVAVDLANLLQRRNVSETLCRHLGLELHMQVN